MSQENVEITRRANEAFNRGDIEEFLTFYNENVGKRAREAWRLAC